jgi:hypothetical protein
MSTHPDQDTRVTVTGQQLFAALQSAGFGVFNEEPGRYVRMIWPKGITGQVSVIVPLSDPAEHKHQQSLSRLLVDLATTANAGRAAQKALDVIYPPQES